MTIDRPLPEGFTKRDGIVYGLDGKPCKQCNSLSDLLNMSKGASDQSFNPFHQRKRPTVDPSQAQSPSSGAGIASGIASALGITQEETSEKAPFNPHECPPDVEQLGRGSWTLLHSMAANYPARPNPVQQKDMSDFIRTFATFYPCWVCAGDFREWMARRENMPVLDQGWAGLGQWMCRAHNEVNEKLGKEKFDCNLWRQRWKDGWKDGRCDP